MVILKICLKGHISTLCMYVLYLLLYMYINICMFVHVLRHKDNTSYLYKIFSYIDYAYVHMTVCVYTNIHTYMYVFIV